jgi:hypothetical protein
MIKRLTISLLSLAFMPCALFAAGISIDSFTVVPSEIYAHKSVTVVFTAHIANLNTPLPAKVKLRRLQADGNMADVSVMRDDGTHGDFAKNDGNYTSTLKLKEPVSGLLCFTVKADFPNNMAPLLSKPLFVKVMGKPWGSK